MDADMSKQYQSTSQLEGETRFPVSLFQICALCVCVCVCAHVCKLPHCGPDCADVQYIFTEGCDRSFGRLRREMNDSIHDLKYREEDERKSNSKICLWCLPPEPTLDDQSTSTCPPLECL